MEPTPWKVLEPVQPSAVVIVHPPLLEQQVPMSAAVWQKVVDVQVVPGAV